MLKQTKINEIYTAVSIFPHLQTFVARAGFSWCEAAALR